MQTDASPTVNPAPEPGTAPTPPQAATSPINSPTPSTTTSPSSAADTPSSAPTPKPSGSPQTQAPDPAANPATNPNGHSPYINWRNTNQSWGYIAVIFHWLSALALFCLFPLGLWMTGLGYYDSWYKLAPDLHKSIGMTLLGVFVARLAWRFWDPAPAPVPGHKAWERKAAHATHLALYLFVFAVMFSGYLISTADGRAIAVFGLFDVPATITSIPKQEDMAGIIHFWLATTLIGITVIHGVAALKHHYLDKDSTLKRITGKRITGKRITGRH